jgi:SnoaL-like domain
MPDTQLQHLADEAAIRKVLDEYCLRLELNSFEEWLELFTEDTVYEVYKLTLRGCKEVAEVLGQAPHGVHIGGAARITIAGDRAETVQNYVFISTSTDEWNSGWYHRTLVRSGAGWKIAHTKVKFARKDDLPENERARKVSFPIRFD